VAPKQSRHRFNAQVSDRDFFFFGNHTARFKCIAEAGLILMCAYNCFRDKPLREQLFVDRFYCATNGGFKGFITATVIAAQ